MNNCAIYIVVKWVVGFLMFWRLPRSDLEGLESMSGKRVSVIIPARNEAENLSEMLERLYKKYS